MINIKPFIDLGWHTVPLRGELKRTEGGAKTVPQFSKNWRETYSSAKNTTVTKIGGVITGKCSGIIAIDCDDSATYALFESFDPDYKFIFKSKGKCDMQGKPKECGTFIYKYDDKIPDTFRIANKAMALDVYSNEGFVYLPTEANETKETIEEIPELTEMPKNTLHLVLSLAAIKSNKEVVIEGVVSNFNCLAPLLKEFINSEDNSKLLPKVFKQLTPKSFRSSKSYLAKGWMHPDDVEEGEGSEYLSKVSAILGKDCSVDEELYRTMMITVNEMFSHPMPHDRLNSTVLDPMVTKASSINGVPIWQYDKDWETKTLSFLSKDNDVLTVAFEPNRRTYILINATQDKYSFFIKEADLISYLKVYCIKSPNKDTINRNTPLVKVVSNPSKPFGFNDDSEFNIFKQTQELEILTNPEPYSSLYSHPEVTLAYLETLVPEVKMREFLLGFIKRKLLHFEYSPVIMYFLGVQGSGKDTFVSLLDKITGGNNIARPSVKEFLGMHNGWLMDSYFVQLDEYGNQLLRSNDKEEALGKLKAYSGKSKVQIRKLYYDGYVCEHKATFILTANKNPLVLEDGDRRLAIFNTPNVLGNQAWVVERGGVNSVYNSIMEESKDFCYYLATKVDTISADEYRKPPSSTHKHTLVADSMLPVSKIAYAIKHNMRGYLEDLGQNYGIKENALMGDRLSAELVLELVTNVTKGKADMKLFNKEYTVINGRKTRATIKGKATYYYLYGE